jgi:hypothetical protein
MREADMSRKLARVFWHLAMLAVALEVGNAWAYDLPSINLGLTSFLDGVLPSGPGLYYQNYVEYYTASRFADNTGARLKLPDESLNLWADTNQFTYYFNDSWGPGRLAVDLVIPSVVSARTNDGLGGAVLKGQSGLGDIFFAPIYEFNPVTLPNQWSLSQSLEFDVLAPTGAYDRRIAINPGSHYWALNPFYSVTLFASPKLSISGRFHYLYNFKNKEPSDALGPDVHTLQAGQAFHFNLASAYAVTEKLGLGINTYYLKQVTETQLNGVGVPGRNERVLGAGPGATYQFDKDSFLFFNFYAETLAQNRAEGDRLVLRFVHHF